MCKNQSSFIQAYPFIRDLRVLCLFFRYRSKRAESIKNEHIMFADEIKEDDEKFTPNPGINDSEVSSSINH